MPRPLNRQTGPAAPLAGILCVALSAVAFGALPIFIKGAYASGAETVAVLALRFTLAALLMSSLMLLRRQPWPRGRNLLILIAMGGIGYVGQSFCFFSALNHASAGLVSLLLYLYPALVTLFAALLLNQPLSRTKAMAVAAALAGTALIVGGDASGSLAGVLLGIGAAVIYSVYILVGSRLMQAEGALPAATVVMLSAGAVFTALAVCTQPALPAGGAGWAAVVAIALVSTVIAMVCFFAGLARLGAADAATISTLEPLVTVLLASLLLGEKLTLATVAGGGIILAALVVLARSR